MPSKIRDQLQQAIRERTEYFSAHVKPQLDALDRTIPPSERMDRIAPEVRRAYQDLCRRVDELQDRGADRLEEVLGGGLDRLLEIIPLMDEASRLERELSLLLPGVADLQPDDHCASISDSRIYKRAVRLHEVIGDLMWLLGGPQAEKIRDHDKLLQALREADDIAVSLVEKNPVCDTAFWRLEADAALLEEFVHRNRRALKKKLK